jgi:hypothetical protein
MTLSRVLLVPLLLVGLASPAPAGFGLFSRKPKANPAERVPELLIQLKTSTDESQRAAAAEELRQYDPKTYPEIIAGLIDALGRDASTAVRTQAAESLGKLRPIAQRVGYALEQAQANDGSMRVRLAARQALWQYHLVGYRSGRPAESPANGGGDVTVSAPPGPSTPAAAMQRPAGARVGIAHPGSLRETAEPPLADAPPAVADQGRRVTPAVPASRPRTAQPTPGQLIPVSPPRLQPAPITPAPAQPAPPAPAEQPVPPAPPPVKAEGDGPVLPPPG